MAQVLAALLVAVAVAVVGPVAQVQAALLAVGPVAQVQAALLAVAVAVAVV